MAKQETILLPKLLITSTIKGGRVVHFHTVNIDNKGITSIAFPTEVTWLVSLAIKVIVVEVIKVKESKYL